MNLLKKLNHLQLISKRFSSKTTRQILNHRAQLFQEEQAKQLKEVERIEKIEVKLLEPGQECTLFMNKNLSTPYNCALHISELFTSRSALAKVDDAAWDMHRPLENSCSLKFLHFKDVEPHELNTAYWRSCSFILGYLLETSFKEDVTVQLSTFPSSNIQSGSFSYDAKLNLASWAPTKSDLRCLTTAGIKLISQNLNFERLNVTLDFAKEIFKYNKIKLNQLESIAKKQVEVNPLKKQIVLYKLGEFVDLCNGPMISNTSHIGRFELTNLYDIESTSYGTLKRLQGVSIPNQLQLHYWTFNLLAERASKPSFNTTGSNKKASAVSA